MSTTTSHITSISICSAICVRRTSKKTSKLRITGLCEGNHRSSGGFPSQRTSNAENVSIWWRHNVAQITLTIRHHHPQIWRLILGARQVQWNNPKTMVSLMSKLYNKLLTAYAICSFLWSHMNWIIRIKLILPHLFFIICISVIVLLNHIIIMFIWWIFTNIPWVIFCNTECIIRWWQDRCFLFDFHNVDPPDKCTLIEIIHKVVIDITVMS